MKLISRKYGVGNRSLMLQWDWSYTTTGADEDATITLSWPGGGTTDVDWGDGNITSITSGVQATHTYAVPGTYHVRLTDQSVWDTLTRVQGCSSNGGFGGDLKKCPPWLEWLNLEGNLVCPGGQIGDLSRALVYIKMNTQSGNPPCYGELADLPPQTWYFYPTEGSTVGGPLSDLPASMLYLYCYRMSGGWISGGDTPMNAVDIRRIYASNDESQENLDDILRRLYLDRHLFTYATSVLNISGFNPSPSGIYQYSANPSTGLEYLYALVNDPDEEGFNKWTITGYAADVQWDWSYTTTGVDEDATITLSWSGGGTTDVNWGDGNITSITSGVQATHTYAVAGTYHVRLADQSVWDTITRIEGCSTNGGFSGTLNTEPSALTYLNLFNTTSEITGVLADSPVGMVELNLGYTQSQITGDVSGCPASMSILNLSNTLSSLIGELSSAPSTLQQLHLFNTTSEITGGSTPVACVGISELKVYSSETQADLDDLLHRLYTDRAVFTYATPTLDISGSNPSPSGIYQYSANPSTGLEYLYALVNDPDEEGFNKWTIPGYDPDVQWDWSYTTTGASENATIKLTWTGGGTTDVNWGDGQITSITSGVQATHTYAVAGTYHVKLTDQSVWDTITRIEGCSANGGFAGTLQSAPSALTYLHLADTQSVITGSSADLPSGLTSLTLHSTQSIITGSLSDLPSGLTYLHLYNTPSTVTGALADLPSGMTFLQLYNTQSTITGALADLPSGMTYIHLASTQSTITGTLSDLPAGTTYLSLSITQSTITGALADLPSGMIGLFLHDTQSEITGTLADLPSGITYLDLGITQSEITGGSTPINATGIRSIYVYSAETQADLDDLLHRLYLDRALFTYATPLLNIAGTNPAPSGIYQYSANPSTGLEYAYALVNDPDEEGFNKWTIPGYDPDVQWDWSYTTTGADEDAAIKLTWDGGGTTDVNWGDGNITSITSGVQATHTYAVAGTYHVRLTDQSVWDTITRIESCSTNCGFSGEFSDGPSGLEWLNLSDTQSDLSGTTADMSRALIYIRIVDTTCAVTGGIADLPSTLVYGFFHSSSSVITGTASELPSGLDTIYLQGTNSTFSGGASPVVSVDMSRLGMNSIADTAADLDDLLYRLYQDRNLFTVSNPVLEIGGSNPAPSGIYQYSANPSTGKEYAYALVNDPDAEGFNKWTIPGYDPDVQWDWSYTTTGASEDATIKLTWTGGGTTDVDWGDGNTTSITSGVQATHTYASPGTYQVLLVDQSVWDTITRIEGCSSNGLFVGDLKNAPQDLTYIHLYNSDSSITGTLVDLPSGVNHLYLSTTQCNITGTLADLPSGMTYLNLRSTPSVITGTLADLPSGMNTLYLSHTQSAITGTLADIPSGMVYLYLDYTLSSITGALSDLPSQLNTLYLSSTTSEIIGGDTPIVDVGIQNINVWSSETQSDLDDMLYRLYLDRASLTNQYLFINIAGGNQSPSGVYQYSANPSTGKEYAYILVNDPDGEGFKTMSIAMN